MSVNAAEALLRLRAGNQRYVADEMTLDISHDVRRRLAAAQEPFAIILGCSDSRVPIEVVFDQGIGDLFVIRIAGNIVQPSQIGSVEFAVQKFGTQLVVVLGHTQCGAIEATIEELRRPATNQSGNMAAIVSRVRPSVEGLLDEIDDYDDLVYQAVRENVRYAANALRHGSRIIESFINDHALTIVGAEYSLETGVVDFFDGVSPA
ncbi:MAG: carbonic anhydrase [Gammaproteobacteria bacterium]|nr:carbonic anhydrase [Gammaproteobacteria bacterium]